MRLPTQERFWAKVDQSGVCWKWTGATDRRGYGRVGIREQGRSKSYLAHRVAYMYAHSALADDFELDHLCRNPACVNPSHLEVVSHLENVRRGFAGQINNAQSRKTHCPRGHPLNGANLYQRIGGGRECKECRRDNVRRWRGGNR